MTKPTAHFTRANGWWFATISGTKSTELDAGGRHWTGYTDSTSPEELVKALGHILEDATVTFEEATR